MISNSFNFFRVFKDFLINMVTILMMSAKLASPELLKIKLFQNKGYDAIIPMTHQQSLSRDSNYTVDVIMWPKFGNCSNFYERSYHSLNIIRVWPKKPLFWGVALVSVQLFRTSTRYDLEILHQCGKRVKTKGQKVLGVNSIVCKSYKGKNWLGSLFAYLNICIDCQL